MAGIGVHADEAIVNFNMWITPQEYNLETATGGLRVWPQRPPLEWSFQEYNSAQYEARNERWLREVTPTDVAYRTNRAVIFSSFFFHKTLPSKFKNGHAHRRINLTFLFGSLRKGVCD